MDFKRIEVIFIIAFFFLDIFLLVGYYNRTDTNYASSPSQSLNLISEMSSQKIQLPEFSEEKHSVAYVQADAQNLLKQNRDKLSQQTGKVTDEDSLYVSILSNPIQLSGEKKLTADDRKKLDQFVQSDQVLFGKDYHFFQYQADNGRIIYNQVVSGLPIADGTSSVVLFMDSSHQVISYEQRYAGPVTEQGSKVELITDRKAVETLFQNNEISPNAKIEKPILIYYRTLKLEDLSMYAPVWYVRVTESSGTGVLRVDAIDGKILSGDPMEKPSDPIKEQEEENKENEAELEIDSSINSSEEEPETAG